MKYLVSCFLLLPILTSCNSFQEEYYESHYYHHGPRIEAHRYNDGYHGHHRQKGYHGQAVVINPMHPQPHVTAGDKGRIKNHSSINHSAKTKIKMQKKRSIISITSQRTSLSLVD